MTAPAGPPPPPGSPTPTTAAASADAPADRPTSASAMSGIVLAVSLVPTALAVLVMLLAPGFFEPLWDERVSVLGLAPAIAFALVLAAVPAVNLVVLWTLRHPIIVAFTTAVTTTTGIFAVILAPAIILILVNLRTTPD